MSERSQFDLLKSRRFLPFFLTQFAGAFNDNVFKNALVVSIALAAARTGDEERASLLVNLCAALFILPFFLFSASAGQLAETHEKSRLIRWTKIAEIAVMAIGAFAFMTGSIYLLIAILFLMGAQSAFFGPVKYAILPQHLGAQEIIGGNGLVEMGTFVAILLGTLAGGLLIGAPGGSAMVAATVVAVAVLGWLASLRIPEAPATAPTLKFNWNLLAETWNTVQIATRTRAVWLSVLGNSWFWLLGAAYLTQLPNYAQFTLGGNEQVITLLLAIFSIGVGVGAMLCEKLSGRMVELGLVPFGSLGLSVFGIDLYFAANDTWHGGPLRDALGYLADPASWRVLFDLAMIGVFGGFYIVPLFAIIQTRTAPEFRSRVIAATNIMNALFMVISAAIGVLLLSVLDLSIPAMFLALAILNVLVAIYIYSLVPEFLMRFLVWLLTSGAYRIRRNNLDAIPDQGPALVVCNHVSYVDAMILAGSSRRVLRFVMDAEIFKIPVLNFVFRTAGAIPITSQKRDPAMYEQAFARIASYLRDGEVVCIFPEGQLTRDGVIGPFRSGVERILRETPVPVIPMALRGLWGSYFSFKHGKGFLKLPRRFWSRIELVVGDLLHPMDATAALLEERVRSLRGDWP